jgi:hypothetical protein
MHVANVSHASLLLYLAAARKVMNAVIATNIIVRSISDSLASAIVLRRWPESMPTSRGSTRISIHTKTREQLDQKHANPAKKSKGFVQL